MSHALAPRLDVFFYGLFMDEDLLRSKGLDPLNRRLAAVTGFRLVIGKRATLVQSAGETVHGVVFALSQPELDSLYSEPSVSIYRPETVRATLVNGETVEALCFNLPTPPHDSVRNLEYAVKLAELATRIGLPADYVASIQR
jgi:hypothetical protein